MIISASRRTDIPAFYSEWFFNRISEGFVITRNPYDANQLTKYQLDPSVVDAIVFWTKNAEPMLARLDELKRRGFVFYFQYTLNPYERDVEPGLPDNERLISTFIRLSKMIGKDRVIWRYDPIFFSKKYSAEWHKRKFAEYCSLLKSRTKKVVISFLDMEYNNTKQIHETGIYDGSICEKYDIANAFAKIAHQAGLEIESCAEEINLEKYGINHGKCVDDVLIKKLLGCCMSVGKDKNQRQNCGCVASVDIGVYNTCAHECLYCYANYAKSSIARNRKQHNSESPLLLGECDVTSVEFKKGQKSYIRQQLSIFQDIAE